MNEDGVCISTNHAPVFVCERCAGMIRVLFYNPDDIVRCTFCGTKMTKTEFTLSDEAGHMMYDMNLDSRRLQDIVFRKYVRDSKLYDPVIMRNRMIERREMADKDMTSFLEKRLLVDEKINAVFSGKPHK